jgi:hypothetical protein
MYQEWSGVTPVTAVEQPVGMILDKRQGLTRSVEKWTGTVSLIGESTDLGGGVYRILSTAGAASEVYVPGANVVGRWYEVTFTIDSISSGGVGVGTPGSPNFNSAGPKHCIVQATNTSATLKRTGITDATVSNVSFKEIQGSAATQSTSASRPVLSARINKFVSTEDFTTGSVWTNTALGAAVAPVITNNYATAPDDTQTAGRVQLSLGGATTSSDMSRLRQTVTGLTSAFNYVHSLWVRSTDGVSSYDCHLIRPDGAGQNLTITPTWTRVSATSAGPGTGSAQLGIMLRGGQTPTHSDTADFLVWHPQFEDGSTATRYQRVGPQRNLLTKTDEIDNAAYSKVGSTIVANQVINPLDGKLNADLWVGTSGAATEQSLKHSASYVSGTTYVASVYLKYAGQAITRMKISSLVIGGTSASISFNTQLGTVVVGSGNANLLSYAIEAAGDGWYRCQATFTASVTVTSTGGWWLDLQQALGDGVTGVYIYGSQLEVGTVATAYERVDTTATTYDTVGFAHYLKFDGVDDSLATPTAVDFSASSSMLFTSGVRKLSDSATGTVFELSAASGTNAGSFQLRAPNGAATNYMLGVRGATTEQLVTATPYVAPITNVLASAFSTSGSVALRVDGAAVASGAGSDGGNFGNYQLYIGRRGGTTTPFNGHLYGLIIRGAASSDAQILAAESLMNDRIA